jgi:hypothetical protein
VQSPASNGGDPLSSTSARTSRGASVGPSAAASPLDELELVLLVLLVVASGPPLDDEDEDEPESDVHAAMARTPAPEAAKTRKRTGWTRMVPSPPAACVPPPSLEKHCT